MNPVEPIYHLSDPTANALPETNNSAEQTAHQLEAGRYRERPPVRRDVAPRGRDSYESAALHARLNELDRPEGCTEVWVTGSGGGGGGGYQTGSSTAGKAGYVIIEWSE